MNWLDSMENENSKSQSEYQTFRKNLDTLFEVLARTRNVLKGLQYEIKNNELICRYYFNRKESRRHFGSNIYSDDLDVIDIDRLLRITHQSNSHLNDIHLFEEERSWVSFNYYDDNNSTWQKQLGTYELTKLKLFKTDTELKAISSDKWVEVLGWIVNKSPIPSIN